VTTLARRQLGGGPLGAADTAPFGIAFAGDSLTNFWYPFSQMWHNSLCAQSGGYLRHRGKFALGGMTLADIETTYLPAALALNPLPGAVVIAGGTNDHSQAGYTLADSAATLQRCINRCRALGVLPVLWLVPPRQDNTSYNTRASNWNVYVRALAQSQGLPLFDFHTPVVDPTTGTTAAAYVGDTVHPNMVGHQVAAAYNLARPEFLARFTDCTPHLTHDVLDPANLVGSGYGLFGAITGSWPTGWTGFGSITASLVSDAQAVGNWVRLSRASGATGTAAISPSTSPTVAAGDKIALACRYRTNYLMASNTGVAGLQLSLNPQASDNSALGTSYVHGPLFGTYSGVAYGEMVMPATTVKVKAEARVTGTTNADSYVDIAQFTVLNLTALGMSGLTTTAVL
jgi:lysophospholipase L1-like esterase